MQKENGEKREYYVSLGKFAKREGGREEGREGGRERERERESARERERELQNYDWTTIYPVNILSSVVGQVLCQIAPDSLRSASLRESACWVTLRYPRSSSWLSNERNPMQTFNANHAIMSAFSNSQNTETPLSEVFCSESKVKCKEHMQWP